MMFLTRLMVLSGLFVAFAINGFSQDSLLFKGVFSAWANYNPDNQLSCYSGIRYIPTLDYSIRLNSTSLIDCEISADIYGDAGVHPFDSTHVEGKFQPYRMWVRYSTNQFELRLGLQKINFGSATLFRPLMWFDQLDPRDPLQLTNGVWGLLGRYYFLNNANIWVWGLYGNTQPLTWETGKTSNQYPELGGRIQTPVPKGEVALSYHFREVDTTNLVTSPTVYNRIAENRIGIDGKWDLGVGLWTEGTWINKNRNVGMYTNQELLTCGTDYTFGIGNGLNVVFEHLLASYNEKAFHFANTISFSGTSISYPIGIFDNVSAIIYYDWTNRSLYNFATWKKQYNKIAFYLMAYWNPTNYQLPQQSSSGTLFAGKGVQFMFVYNH
jgi:hypothetical protein